MTKRVAWAATEDDTLLRAWADVEMNVSLKRVVNKALFMRFEELRGSAMARTELAVERRRHVFIRMHDIISQFNARSDEPPPQEQQEQQFSYSSAEFFELSYQEQRHWIRTIDPGGHGTINITRDTFDRIGAILALASSSVQQQQQQQQQLPERKRFANLLPLPDGAGKKARVAPAPFDIVIAAYDSDASDSSSTESEDDDVARAHLADSDDDSKDDTDEKPLSLLAAHTHSRLRQRPSHKPATPSTAKRERAGSDSPWALAPRKPQMPVAVSGAPASTSTAMAPLDASAAGMSDIARLVRLLSDQAQLLHTMLEQAQHEREREDRERCRAARDLRQSYELVLDEVQRCERVLTRQSDVDERERVVVKRELTRLQSERQQQRTGAL